MKGIPYYISGRSQHSEFTITYLNHIKILTIAHKTDHDYRNELVIDSSLLINTNTTDVLVNIEIMIPSSKWKRNNNLIEPKIINEGKVVFPELEKNHQYECSNVSTSYSSISNSLLVLFINDISYMEAIIFSTNCQIITCNNFCTGFYFKNVL